jgi:hypothetical protein
MDKPTDNWFLWLLLSPVGACGFAMYVAALPALLGGPELSRIEARFIWLAEVCNPFYVGLQTYILGAGMAVALAPGLLLHPILTGLRARTVFVFIPGIVGAIQAGRLLVHPVIFVGALATVAVDVFIAVGAYRTEYLTRFYRPWVLALMWISVIVLSVIVGLCGLLIVGPRILT